MDAFGVIEQTWWLGIPTALFLGVLLGMNPLALPMLGTALALGATGEAGTRGGGVRLAAAFGAGMAIVYTAIGFVAGRVDEVTEDFLRPYSGIGYLVLGLVLMGIAGWLLFRPNAFCTACARPLKHNPTTLGAFLAGIPGGFVNCPACAGIILGVAAAAATGGNAVYSGSVMLALGVGHGAILTGLAWLITNRRRPSGRVLALAQKIVALAMVALAVYFVRLAVLSGIVPGPRLP